ncbi:hypothetical protein CRENBAI_001374 [Crenichthys baileyi]|uniref:Uncharacterized protein n=1 Tax=Crenichthys baileyi TaxID=28760 RepID=A0AAV9QTS9_9TELE
MTDLLLSWEAAVQMSSTGHSSMQSCEGWNPPSGIHCCSKFERSGRYGGSSLRVRDPRGRDVHSSVQVPEDVNCSDGQQLQRGETKRQELYTGSLTGLVCHSRSEAAAIHNDSWEDRGSRTGIQAWMQEGKWRKESCRAPEDSFQSEVTTSGCTLA